jgi:hypothetical protein
MNPAAAKWLEVLFDLYGRNLDPRSTHIGPMVALKNDIEPCKPMDVDSVDYKDPERLWL